MIKHVDEEKYCKQNGRKPIIKNVTIALNCYMSSTITWEKCKVVFGLATKQEIIAGVGSFMAQVKHEYNKKPL